ncbi:hypothetical protein [Altericroceibacterium endophyticum]|uniref:DUF4815 domain-containing protein n=1 Tax=Altericroceibacterium endophyticum TaxID=1808508 RepID=A0A6I4T4T6_9SPHN|nr:hypothetical protein [Altericroceibacterium endophyticum]MXO66254.1 hypothetical protein [Altericroceibacterium endophyticum]
MEKIVNFRDGMDLSSTDLKNIQSFAQESLDHIVADTVTTQRKYAGFASVMLSGLRMQVSAGRLYDAGRVFNMEAAIEHDFTAATPVQHRKICSLVAWSEVIETGETSREILIDVENQTTEAQTVMMETRRVARLSVRQGVESPDPVAPAIVEGQLEIARITLTTTGIESIAMVADNALPSTAAHGTRLAHLETFRRDAQAKVQGLSGDIAALTEGQANMVGVEQYGQVLDRLASVEAKTGVPDSAVSSFADFLLDESASDTGFAGYHAKVEEGIRFPEAASSTTALALKNPIDPGAKLSDGLLLPAYDRDLRFSTGAPTGEVKLNGYSYQTNELTRKTLVRYRLRHGILHPFSSRYAFLKSGRYDLLGAVFTKQGEVLQANAAARSALLRNHIFWRRHFHWVDKVEVPYWDTVTVDHTVPGTQVTETFLQANDMVLDALGLWFTKLAADGAVTVAICETEHGVARTDQVIAQTTLDRADLSVEKETIVPLPPTFLTGGKRYAILVMTAADHYLGTVQGSVYPQGTFFYVLDGQYQQGDGTKDIAFSLYGAKFRQSRAVIDLAEVQLADGIADIDILTQATEPGATELTFFVQIGGVWYPLSDSETTPLAQGNVLQNLLPLRVVMTGTPEVMPILKLAGSQLTVSRPDLSFSWISEERHLPGSGSDEIVARFELERFDEADHTLTPSLLTGAAYGTETAPDSVSDSVTDDGTIQRTAIWSLDAVVTDFRLKLTGTTSSAQRPFHVAVRRDHAL